MKRILFAICCFGLLWSGCKEHDAPINFGNNVFKDTTYVLPSLPPADPHEVLVEEFTGQSCPACPSGHAQLESISAQHDTLINVIGLYITDFLQTRPPSGAVYDFRDSLASIMGGSGLYGGIVQLPIAGIDRTRPSAGASMLWDQSFWLSTVNSRLTVPDSLNLAVSSSFNTTDSEATINVKVTYLNFVTTAQYLSIAITEDSMVDIQEDGTTFDNNYLFTWVFRGMATAVPMGDLLTSLPSKEPGRVVQKVYKYKLQHGKPSTAPPINPAHCKVIAFVSADGTGGDYHVLQSAHCKLMQ